jgi:hypothetical protein
MIDAMSTYLINNYKADNAKKFNNNINSLTIENFDNIGANYFKEDNPSTENYNKFNDVIIVLFKTNNILHTQIIFTFFMFYLILILQPHNKTNFILNIC